MELAIDFGSGVGRLTQAWADRFARVIGVDISPTMIAVAQRVNRHGDRVEYLLNDRADLSLLSTASASLVSTHITLQHVPPAAAERYIREFLRIAKPGGGVIFQLPSHYSDSYLPSDRDDQPVPEAARRAHIEVVDPPASMPVDSTADLLVDVTNTSDRTWVQSAVYPLRVGNHWRPTAHRLPSVNDDGRTRLPGRVHPGESVRLPLRICAPAQPGTYRLVLDVVQEIVSWFEDVGGTPAELQVDVVPVPVAVQATDAAADVSAPPGVSYGDEAFADLIQPDYAEAPMFEMNAIHRDVVAAVIAGAGASLLGVDEWVNEWHSFTYYVQAN
jgi:hypothetical protein